MNHKMHEIDSLAKDKEKSRTASGEEEGKVIFKQTEYSQDKEIENEKNRQIVEDYKDNESFEEVSFRGGNENENSAVGGSTNGNKGNQHFDERQDRYRDREYENAAKDNVRSQDGSRHDSRRKSDNTKSDGLKKSRYSYDNVDSNTYDNNKQNYRKEQQEEEMNKNQKGLSR